MIMYLDGRHNIYLGNQSPKKTDQQQDLTHPEYVKVHLTRVDEEIEEHGM